MDYRHGEFHPDPVIRPRMETIGRYQVLKTIGQGAMGRVVLAEDPALGRKVAIKVISASHLIPGAGTAVWLRARFTQEARAIALLAHPHIVTIFDIDEEGDQAYIVMEYVAGPNLRTHRNLRPIPREELARIVKEIAAGLDFAHAKGVVHRDIKPENVLLDAAGSVKIADFGLAKLAAESLSTDAGKVVGTLRYMAPEQLETKPLTGAADQYSLAAMTYELLAGRPVFEAEAMGVLGYKILHEVPQPPHALASDVPASTGPVFDRALAKDPAIRFHNCAAFAAALESSLLGQAEAETQTFAPAPPPVAQVTPPSLMTPQPESRRTIATIAVAGILAACVAIAFLRPGPKPSSPPPRQHVVEPRIETPPPVVPQVAPVAPPAPKPRIEKMPPLPHETHPPKAVPASGSLVWTGDLESGQEIDMAGGAAAGVTGTLPGLPVKIQDVHPSSVHVVTAPGPANHWHGLVVRNDGRKQGMIIVRWATIQ
jgi:serine/threonine-protein kinase